MKYLITVLTLVLSITLFTSCESSKAGPAEDNVCHQIPLSVINISDGENPPLNIADHATSENYASTISLKHGNLGFISFVEVVNHLVKEQGFEAIESSIELENGSDFRAITWDSVKGEAGCNVNLIYDSSSNGSIMMIFTSV